MDERILWVWLTRKFIPGTMKIPDLLKYYGDIREIYEKKSFRDVGFLSADERSALEDKSLEEAYEICSRVNQANARILVYDDEKYPELLRHIESPPYVLYVKGKVIDWERYLLISVVGTRKCTGYGIKATSRIAGELASRGVVIVSGLARGLDSVATIEALKHNCYTIGVLGCGIDIVYPPANKKLFDAVEKSGLIISEYPPGTEPSKITFPQRNRIMAGISRGVLVTEAPVRSGALITARLALENGRDVYAVPGSIFEPTCMGTNKLLQSSAKSTSCAQDILDEYPDVEHRLRAPMGNVFMDNFPEVTVSEMKIEAKPKHTKKQDKKSEREPDIIKEENQEEAPRKLSIPDDLNDKEKKIAECLLEGEKHKDEIIRETGLEAAAVNTALVLLEMSGVVTAMPSNKYKLQ